jgi:large repetitive protein
MNILIRFKYINTPDMQVKIRSIKHVFTLLVLITSWQYSDAQNCTVNAGLPISWCPGETMTLYGNVAGVYDGTQVQWTRVSGPVVTIANSHSLTTTTGPAQAGATYVFRLSAICGDMTAVFDEVTYTVAAATPQPPATSAGSNINAGCLAFGQFVQLNATAAPPGFSGRWTSSAGSFDDSSSPTAKFFPSKWANSCSTQWALTWTLVSNTPPDPSCPNSQLTSSASMSVNANMYDPVVDAYAITPGCGSTANTVQLIGSCPGSGSGVWTLISGPQGFNFNPTSGTSISVSNLITGNYTFRYTISSSCLSGFDEVSFSAIGGATYVVTSAVANSNGLPEGYCDGMPGSIQLSANSPNANETGTWTQVSGGTTLTFSDIHDPNAMVTGQTIAGAPYTLRWTITNAMGCSSTSTRLITYISGIPNHNDVNLTIGCSQPIYSNTNGWQVCTASPYAMESTPFMFSPGLPQGGGWYLKGATINARPAGAAVNLGYIPGSGMWSYNPGTHGISVKDCANNPGIAIMLSWSGGTTSLLSIWVESPLIPGVYAGVLHYKNSYCGLEFDEPFFLNIQHTPSASNAGTDQNLACSSNQTFLAGSNPHVTSPYFGTGVWEQLSGPTIANIVSPSSSNSQVTGLIDGTYAFVWRISAGDACGSRQDTVTVRASSIPPSPVSAGPDLNVCFGTPVTLAADLNPSGNLPQMLSATGSLGTWSLISGPPGATITNATSTIATVNGLIANSTYVFRYTASNLCGSQFDEVTVNTSSNQGPSQANTGNGTCSNTGTSTFNLSATAPTFGSGLWSKLNPLDPGAITSPGSASTTVTGVSSSGVFGYIWTVSSAGCGSTSDTMFFSNTGTLSNANAGPDQNICALPSASTFNLSANAPVNGTGVWSQVTGPVGAVFDPNTNNTVVTAITDGQYTFQWTISNGVCPVRTDQVVVNFYHQPSLAVITTTDTVLCSNSGGQLQIAAQSAVFGNGAWMVYSNAPGYISNPNSPVTQARVRPGITTLRWAITSPSAVCSIGNNYDEVVVQYTPSANARNDTTLCEATSTLLIGSDPGAGVGAWSVVSQPAGSPVVNFVLQGNDSTYSAGPLVIGSYTFRWTVSSAGCVTTMDDKTVINSSRPSPPSAGNDTCVVVGSVMNLRGSSLPPSTTALWTRVSAPQWAGDAQQSYTPSNTVPVTNYSMSTSPSWNYPAGLYTFQYRITQTGGGCSISDYVSIRALTAALAGPDQSDCNRLTPFTMAANAPSTANGEVGTWVVIRGAPTIQNVNQYNTQITVSPGDTAVLGWQIGVSVGCVAPMDTIVLLNRGQFAGPDRSLDCIVLPGGSVQMQALGAGTWSQEPGNPATVTISSLTAPNAQISSFTMEGTYNFRWTISAGCYDLASVLVSEAVSAGANMSDLCVPSFPGGSFNMAGSGPGEWEPDIANPGTAVIDDTDDPLTTIHSFSTGGQYRFFFSSSYCRDTVIIEVASAVIDLEIDKVVDDANPFVGQTVNFTITVHNNGPCDASGVEVYDAVPAGYSIVSTVVSKGTWVAPDFWDLGTLGTGQTDTLTVTATVVSAGAYTNSAEVDAIEFDSDLTNNNSSVPLINQTNADLRIVKTVSADPVPAGSQVEYTLNLSNLGPMTANSVSVTDVVPAILGSPQYSINGGSSWANWTGSLNMGNINSGDSRIILIRGSVSCSVLHGTVLSNTASVGSTTGDADLSNNSSSVIGSVSNAADPGLISGPASICKGSTGVYSITALPGASSYFWTIPPGSTLLSGQGTPTIELRMGSQGGNICVRSSNAHCESSQSCLPVSAAATPSRPAIIHPN